MLIKPCSRAAPASAQEYALPLRGWPNTVGNLIELFWLKTTCHRPQSIGLCVKNRGVRFHRTRDFKQHYFNSIPPTSHCSRQQHQHLHKSTHFRASIGSPAECLHVMVPQFWHSFPSTFGLGRGCRVYRQQYADGCRQQHADGCRQQYADLWRSTRVVADNGTQM